MKFLMMQERYVGYQRVKIHGVYAGKNERNGEQLTEW